MPVEVHVGDILVHGVDIDSQTRCHHYRTEVDRIAIKFPCCREYFSCHLCHQELADHAAGRWSVDQFDENAILCGNCGAELTIREYLDGPSSCPFCEAKFNPGCKTHAHLYFEGF